MAKVQVLNEVLPSYHYEVGLLTKTDNKNYQFKFIVENKLSDILIKETIEEVSDCWVESIKRVTKYKRKYHVESPVGNGLMLTGEYKINGVYVKTNSLYLPDVRYQHIRSLENLEKELKKLFGVEFKIVAFSPR